MAKHTPGPWRIDANNPRKVVSDSLDGLDPLTGENVVGGASLGPHSEGNANLIAAAPDMLAALRLAARDLYSGATTPGTYPAVLAALAKAEGIR